MRWLDSMTDSMDINLSKLLKIVKYREHGVLQSMVSQRVRHDLVREQKQSYTAFSTFAGIDKKTSNVWVKVAQRICLYIIAPNE